MISAANERSTSPSTNDKSTDGSTRKNIKTLGVLGGMGPAATAEFYKRVIAFTDAATDQEHVPTIMLSDPDVPDRTAYLANRGGEPFADTLNRSLLKLEELGCTVLAIPCNTAHACTDEITAGLTRTELIDMPLETVKLAASLGCKKLGLLATDGTLVSGVYPDRAAPLGLETVTPSDEVQKGLMSLIYESIKAGKPCSPSDLDPARQDLADKGCDCILIACTELSILMDESWGGEKDVSIVSKHGDIFEIDALDVLAWKSVTAAGAKTLALPDCLKESEPSN